MMGSVPYVAQGVTVETLREDEPEATDARPKMPSPSTSAERARHPAIRKIDVRPIGRSVGMIRKEFLLGLVYQAHATNERINDPRVSRIRAGWACIGTRGARRFQKPITSVGKCRRRLKQRWL